MPLHDWQFWVATILMLAAIWLAYRAIAPRRRSANDPSCPSCTSGPSNASSKRRVSLTIEKRRI